VVLEQAWVLDQDQVWDPPASEVQVSEVQVSEVQVSASGRDQVWDPLALEVQVSEEQVLASGQGRA
jgi:hypothetical protein